MIAAPVEPQSWPKRRWWMTVAFVMLGQLGLIFWLTGRDVVPRAANLQPSLILPAETAAELPDLGNPTLFALPNRRGFSGPAWMDVSPLTHPALEWVEPPLWLTQNIAGLGGAFTEFISTNRVGSFQVVKHTEPQTEVMELYSPFDRLPTRSTVRVEGELVNRPLTSSLTLTSWPATENVLTNSEVEIGVGANGRVFSSVLLAGSGSRQADNFALNLARTARFQSLVSAGDLSWGKLVFQWHTIAPTATNPATTGP
jgi:hypothetical protein